MSFFGASGLRVFARCARDESLVCVVLAVPVVALLGKTGIVVVLVGGALVESPICGNFGGLGMVARERETVLYSIGESSLISSLLCLPSSDMSFFGARGLRDVRDESSVRVTLVLRAVGAPLESVEDLRETDTGFSKREVPVAAFGCPSMDERDFRLFVDECELRPFVDERDTRVLIDDE
jgi:hypothetical protein